MTTAASQPATDRDLDLDLEANRGDTMNTPRKT
jgi:hypothetical protein